MDLTNTQLERRALSSFSNLSDGHARIDLDSREREIVGQILEIYDFCTENGQTKIEDRFLKSFFEGSSIAAVLDQNAFLAYASSCSIKIIAQMARLLGKKVLLIEPCFDNIFHLLKTEGVSIMPVGEMHLTTLWQRPEQIDRDTWVWAVLPNNPTGFWLSEDELTDLAILLRSRSATLVVDSCFRRFVPSNRKFDIYNILEKTGVSYIVIEDTGKTWSTLDLKAGITVCSADYSSELARLHDQLLLSVSPITLELLTRLIIYGSSSIGQASFNTRVANNRRLVEGLGALPWVKLIERQTENVPMVLLQLGAKRCILQNHKILRDRGVDLLPTSNYYWSGAVDDLACFRFPLLKPAREIEHAVSVIKENGHLIEK